MFKKTDYDVEAIEIMALPKHYIIYMDDDKDIEFDGWHRKDLDEIHQNWHYYQTSYNSVLHIRKDKIIYVEEFFG